MTTYMQYSHTESLPLILFIACTILVATAAKVSSAPHTLDLGARFDSSFSLEYHVLSSRVLESLLVVIPAS